MEEQPVDSGYEPAQQPEPIAAESVEPALTEEAIPPISEVQKVDSPERSREVKVFDESQEMESQIDPIAKDSFSNRGTLAGANESPIVKLQKMQSSEMANSASDKRGEFSTHEN